MMYLKMYSFHLIRKKINPKGDFAVHFTCYSVGTQSALGIKSFGFLMASNINEQGLLAVSYPSTSHISNML